MFDKIKYFRKICTYAVKAQTFEFNLKALVIKSTASRGKDLNFMEKLFKKHKGCFKKYYKEEK